jgi:hypothetical protein
MKPRHPLKHILNLGRAHWDHGGYNSEARSVFGKVLDCGTLALGAEVYASDVEEKQVCHTCKSRGCSSCGYRNTIQWERERCAAMPDIGYKGVTFTQPDKLWAFFADNPRLLHALPALAYEAVRGYVLCRYGVLTGMIAIPQTFNGQLGFNPHVHTMVTAGGLHTASSQWFPRVYLDELEIMRRWRRGVIDLLRAALHGGRLNIELPAQEVEVLLTAQEHRDWNINIQSLASTKHFLRYAGRYLLRPPIAQGRIKNISDGAVKFEYKNKKTGGETVTCPLEEFIDRWAQHIHRRYSHLVRYFGLFAPRTDSCLSALVFALLCQKRRPRPRKLSWAWSIEKHFGFDPLLDKREQRMKWVRRLPAAVK